MSDQNPTDAQPLDRQCTVVIDTARDLVQRAHAEEVRPDFDVAAGVGDVLARAGVVAPLTAGWPSGWSGIPHRPPNTSRAATDRPRLGLRPHAAIRPAREGNPLVRKLEIPVDGLKRSTRLVLIEILIVALVVGGGFAASYFLNARNYVSTDNDQIDGQQIMVNAPAAGTLLDWRISQGAQMRKDEIVGRIKLQDGFAQPLMSIRAPADGTVAVDNGVPGTFVTAGTQLATAYDLNDIYVTARVDETDVKAVRVGQTVDITVDAYPHKSITGRVREIQGGAANVFSLFPQSNTEGNFQKVTQVIPVKIGIDNFQDLDLVPGMNVTVHIHKH